jgi:hypothetical protein
MHQEVGGEVQQFFKAFRIQRGADCRESSSEGMGLDFWAEEI